MKNENYEFPRVVPVPVKNICTCNLYKIVRSDVVNLRMERVYIQTYVNIFVNLGYVVLCVLCFLLTFVLIDLIVQKCDVFLFIIYLIIKFCIYIYVYDYM